MFIRGENRLANLAGVGVAVMLTAASGMALAQQPNQLTAEQMQAAPFGASEPSAPTNSQPSAPAEAYPAAPPNPGYEQDGSEDAYGDTALVPPNVEGAPYAAEDGEYCYVGGHPVDTRAVPGPAWDATQGQHMRPYAPIDTRLFAFRDGCYYFTGDPRDFGYDGQTYSYYGAHPVLDTYGGGWCFMMGGHTHLWAPWSPYFTVVGPWYYWHGPYDPFFWAYWPYYSFYYRSYYPHYYGGGRFYRGGGYRVAPPIRSVPTSAWRGRQGPGRVAPPVRGTAPAQMYRGFPTTAPSRSYSPPAASRPGLSPPAAPRPGLSPPATPRPAFSPPTRSFTPPRSGGFGMPGGGPRGGHR